MKEEKELTEEELEFKKHKEGLWDSEGTELQKHMAFFESKSKTDVNACFVAAQFLLFGKQDFVNGFKYANAGVELGSDDCYALIGKCFEKGMGVRKNSCRAAEIYNSLAKKGNVFATYALANLYLFGEGVDKNPAKARKMFEQLAENGYPKAKYKLGVMYQYGLSVCRNFNKAFCWYNRAVEEDDYARAYYNLGYLYLKGKGTKLDHEKAFKYFSLGAENHDDHSTFMLAKCYFRSIGTKKDVRKSIKLLKKVEQKGVETSKSYLEDLVGYKQNPIDEKQAIKTFFESPVFTR